MFTKATILCLVSLGIIFWGTISNCLADTAGDVEQAKQQIFALIQSGNSAGADSATNKLITDFNNGPGVDEAVHQIALKHQGAKNYQKTIELSRRVVTNWPQSPHASWAQMDIVMSDVLLGNETAAQAEIETLITKYRDDPSFPWMLRNIGQAYRKEALGQLLKKHFNSDSPAKIKLAILDIDVMAKIESCAYDAACQDVNKMIAEFSSDTDLPEMLLTIAQQFSWFYQYERAGSLYQQVVQRFPDSPSAVKARQCVDKTGQIANITSKLIESGNYSRVKKAAEELIANFGDEVDTPSMICDIGFKLEVAGQFTLARQVYEQVIWRYPKNAWFADMARMGVQRNKVLALDESGDEAGAKSTFDNILINFKEHSSLPGNVMWIAEDYYRKACKANRNGDSALAKKLFDKTMVTTDVVLTKFSASTEVPNALYLAAECHYQLNDYQTAVDLFQKVADGYPSFHMASNALYMVAETYQALKKSGAVSQPEADLKTRSAYEKLLEKYPGCPFVGAAQRWLDKNGAK